MAAAQLSKTLWFPSVLAITALITFVTLYNDSQGIGNVTLITNLGCTTASLLTPRGDPLARPGLVQETSANPAAVCQTLPWQPAAYQIPGGGMLKCDNEEHCSFVFRDVCIQRNQSGGGYQEYKWILEVPGGCEIPTPATPPATQACQLENGCGGHRVRIVRPEGGGSVEPGEGGFDPVPTVFLDRSGGQPGNLFHDTSIALYPLFQNMKLRGWRNYAGRRIAITDEYGMPDPAKKGLEELYFAFAPEFTDWRDFTDRKCFKELTLMRTSFKWNCKNYVVTHNPLLNEFADFVGAHFGLPPSRPPLPETPSMFYLHRGGSRKITNWVELMGGLDMPVTIHNTSLSWGEQLAALRKASIVFGLHGAGELL